MYLPLNSWHNIAVNSDDENGIASYYCNITMPPEVAKGRISFVDLELDLHVESDLSVHEMDRDEFNEAIVRMNIPAEIQDRAEHEIAALTEHIRRKAFPFGYPFGCLHP